MTREFTVALNDFVDAQGMPISVTISVDAKYAPAFEQFAEEQEGDMFAHFEGDEIVY